LVSDIDSLEEDQNSVTMMTLHVSKGLEYPYVFIVGLEENLFPSFRSDEEDDGHSIEEERRLCYVGMTRARQKLHLTYARSRKVWGQEQFNAPSRFLKEIPAEFTQLSTAIDTPRFVSQAAGRLGSGESSWGTSSFADKRRSNPSDFDSQDFPNYDEEGSASSGLTRGMKVRHPTFGVGTIFETEGGGDQQKVSVLFADQTIKKFVTKYARLERVR